MFWVGHIALIEQQPTRACPSEAGDEPEHRRLPATGRANQRQQLAGRDLETELVHSHDRSVADGELLDADPHWRFLALHRAAHVGRADQAALQ